MLRGTPSSRSNGCPCRTSSDISPIASPLTRTFPHTSRAVPMRVTVMLSESLTCAARRASKRCPSTSHCRKRVGRDEIWLSSAEEAFPHRDHPPDRRDVLPARVVYDGQPQHVQAERH